MTQWTHCSLENAFTYVFLCRPTANSCPPLRPGSLLPEGWDCPRPGQPDGTVRIPGALLDLGSAPILVLQAAGSCGDPLPCPRASRAPATVLSVLWSLSHCLSPCRSLPSRSTSLSTSQDRECLQRERRVFGNQSPGSLLCFLSLWLSSCLFC